MAATSSSHQPNATLRRVGVVVLWVVPLGIALSVKFPVCISAGLLGIPCPGCGLTRATWALVTGDLQTAFDLYPLVFVMGPLFFGAMGLGAYHYIRGPRPDARPSRPPSRWASYSGGLVLALMLGVWGARFFDYLGGPVPVETYGQWAHSHGFR